MKTIAPFRTPAEALREFKYATDVWFACMNEATREVAAQYAMEAIDRVQFEPNRPLEVMGNATEKENG